MRVVFVGVPGWLWDRIKAVGRLEEPYHFQEEDGRFLPWLMDQVEGRLGPFPTASAQPIVPVYCHLTNNDALRWWSGSARVAILRVRVEPGMLLEFDDHSYIIALNGPLNASNPGGMVPWTESESEITAEDVPAEVGIASCDRMFDFKNPSRDRRWCGKPLVRAVIPWLTRNMVARAKMYSRGVRLHRKKKKPCSRRRSRSQDRENL